MTQRLVMLSLKQIETFYWVAKLGTVQRAADKLFVTQSAATKRLQEVEASSTAPLFEGVSTKSTLTAKGREMYAHCEDLLDAVGRLNELQDPAHHIARVLHVGLTELVVLTWFPTFMRQMRQYYPNVTLQPEIDLSGALRDKVLNGRLDLAVLPEPEGDAALARVELGRAKFAWFCPPGMFEGTAVVPLEKLADAPIIEQTTKSIITVLSTRMFEAVGADPTRIQGGNNVVALGSLIEAGVGASCLPVALFTQQVASGRMRKLITDPPAPEVRYDAVFLKRPHSALGFAVADIARRCCDFS